MNIHGGDIYSDLIEYDFSVNTNPMDCSEVYRTIIKATEGKLGQYPDVEQRKFRTAIADVEGVSPEQVWGGNGASELFVGIINMLKPKKVLLVEPCFAGYQHAINMLADCVVDRFYLSERDNFSVDDSFITYLESKAKSGLELLIIANPNNPTGRLVADDIMGRVYEICRDNNVKIIVDECFIRMCDGAKSLATYVAEYDGLYVVNAFTKLFSIPGIRVGYVLTKRENIAMLKNYLPEWNLSVVAQTAGGICRDYIKNTFWESKTREYIRYERSFLTGELRRMGLKVIESDTDFILFKSDRKNLKELLLRRHILIRDCSNYKGLHEGYYRIAVKDRASNKYLIEVMRSLY